MNNLHLSRETQNDLDEIKACITEEIRILKNQAYVGTPLSSVADTESDYRFLVSGNYLVFYRIYGKDVYIDRVLYSRRDYMRILFRGAQSDETDE